MRSRIKGNTATIVIAMVTAVVTAMGTAIVLNVAPAVGHGVRHAKFAHNADKVDGLHANQLRPVTKGRSYSFQGGAPIHTVAATPVNILAIAFKAPRNGFAQLSYAHTDFASGGDQDVVSWVEVDPAVDCDGTGRVDSSEMFNSILNNDYGNTSAEAVVPLSKGNHRIILCVVAGGGIQVGVASLNATFIPKGSASVSVPPTPRPGAKFGR